MSADTRRAQRADDAANPDYIFMSAADFRQRELAGELLEWCHVLFGMSYGLGWPEMRNGMAIGTAQIPSARDRAREFASRIEIEQLVDPR